jgi:hypothetical protein
MSDAAKVISELRQIISAVFGVSEKSITQFKKLRGSHIVYSFCVNEDKYVIRKPGCQYDGKPERAAYDALKGLGVSDEPLYFDDNGVKIAPFIDGSRMGYSKKDRSDSVALLRRIHQRGITIPYSYDIFGKIDTYFAGAVWNKNKENLAGYYIYVDMLKQKLESLSVTPVLCHGDACVISNYKRLQDGSVILLDWEQAGMADPFLDFAIAAHNQNFDKIKPFRCVQEYLQRQPGEDEIFRIRAYIFLVAFMWSASEIHKNAENFDYYFNYVRRGVMEFGSHES